MARSLPRFWIPFVLCAFFTAFGYNIGCLLADPFDIVWAREQREFGGLAIDQYRFKKTQHLASHLSEFDTIVLGNSRSADLRTAELDKALGRRVYNFSASADAPIGHRLKAAWLARTQRNLRDVVLVLWWDQFQGVGTHWGNHIAREHPALTGESWLSYYWFFSSLPYAIAAKAAVHQLRGFGGLSRDSRPIQHAGLNVGTGDFDAWEFYPTYFEPAGGRAAFEKRLIAEIGSGRVIFRNATIEPPEAAALRQQFQTAPIRDDQREAARDTIRLLRAAGIRAHCVIPPMSAATSAMVPTEPYLAWMRWLVDICGGAWDFSMVSPLTRDLWNYHDASHFTAPIAHRMIRVVLGDQSTQVAELRDISQWVTAATFVDHAENWRRRMAAYLGCPMPRLACPD